MKTEYVSSRPKVATAALCAGLLMSANMGLAAGSAQFDGSKARLNLSSKLEMLTQVIGSASCRLSAGIGVDHAKSELLEARNEFNTILTGLENGGVALGIPSPESDRTVLESLAELRAAWVPFDAAVQTVISDAPDKTTAAEFIAKDNKALLETAQILASDVSGAYSNPQELTQADAIALHIAGRQRTLVHTITKEVCHLAAYDSLPSNLGADIDTFVASKGALMNGMVEAGINPPPNDQIKQELQQVHNAWMEMAPALDSIRQGEPPQPDYVDTFAKASVYVESQMNNVVTLYMLATPGQEDVYRIPLKSYAESQLASWVEHQDLVDAVKAQNAAHAGLTQIDIDQLDAEWRAQRSLDEKPLIDDLISRPTSEWLREKAAQSAHLITEVFVMDNVGLNVAQSGETSDYWQGDEAKWKATFGNGSGDMHISDIELDENTGVYQSQVSLPVYDPASGELIGAVTFGVNVQPLL